MSERFLARRKTFVVSAGRTGTTFLGEMLGSVFPDSHSVHEPDNVRVESLLQPVRIVRGIMEHGGFANQVVLKFLGVSGARNLSLSRITGRIDGREAMRRFAKERSWTDRIGASLYVECNQQLHGLAADLALLPSTQVVLVVRDPRPWIRSMLNHPHGWYGRRDLLQKVDVLGMKRIAPRHVGEDAAGWKASDQTARLAWLWNHVNTRLVAVDDMGLPNVRLFRFEDVFANPALDRVTDFLLAIDPSCDAAAMGPRFVERMGTRVHASADRRGARSLDLSPADLGKVDAVCGNLMRRLGYT